MHFLPRAINKNLVTLLKTSNKNSLLDFFQRLRVKCVWLFSRDRKIRKSCLSKRSAVFFGCDACVYNYRGFHDGQRGLTCVLAQGGHGVEKRPGLADIAGKNPRAFDKSVFLKDQPKRDQGPAQA